MALSLTLEQYKYVISPLASAIAIVTDFWPDPPSDRDLIAPQATIELPVGWETCPAPTTWDATEIQYGTTPITATGNAHQYITVDQTVTVTEVSSYYESAIAIYETITLTEQVTTTTEVTLPTATDVLVNAAKTHLEDKLSNRMLFISWTVLLSFACGALAAISLGKWLQRHRVGQTGEKPQGPADKANGRHVAADNAADFWVEKSAYVTKLAQNHDHETATLDCLRVIFDGAAEPLSHTGMAKELIKYIRSRAVENNAQAVALACSSEDHMRELETAKRVARSHIARYPESSRPLMLDQLLREKGPFVDNIVLQSWLQDLKNNTDLVKELALHKFASCPADVRHPAVGSRRYPRSPSRPVRESSHDLTERGRRRLPRPNVSSRNPSLDRSRIVNTRKVASPSPTRPPVELARRRERLKQVIIQLKHGGVEEDWLQKNLLAVHAAIRETNDAAAATQRIRKLYDDKDLEPRSLVGHMEARKPARSAFSQPQKPELFASSTLDRQAAPAPSADAASFFGSPLHIPRIEVSDAEQDERLTEAESPLQIPYVRDDDTESNDLFPGVEPLLQAPTIPNADIENDETPSEPDSSTARNEQLSPEFLRSYPAFKAEQRVDATGLVSPETLGSTDAAEEQGAESSSSDDNGPVSPSPAPRPGRVELVVSRRASSRDALSRYGNRIETLTSQATHYEEKSVVEPSSNPDGSGRWRSRSGNDDGDVSMLQPTEEQVGAPIEEHETTSEVQQLNTFNEMADDDALGKTEPGTTSTVDPYIIDQRIVDDVENAPLPDPELF